MGPVARLSLVLAHGGIPGLLAETGSVFVALAVFGYFIRRSARKERDQADADAKDADSRRRDT